MIGYATENWKDWLWIEASGKIETLYDEAQEVLINSEIGSTKIPSIISAKIMSGTPVDDYHYIRKMTIKDSDRVQEEISVKKVMFGFRNKETFDDYYKLINKDIERNRNNVDSVIGESYGSLSKIRANITYMHLLQFVELMKYNETEFLSDYTIGLYKRDLLLNQFM